MALTPEEQYLLIGVVSVLCIFVIYFELRVMRRKSGEARKVAVVKDEAFNSVLTMRSVQNSLSNQGRDTGRSSEFIDMADQARRRGDYVACMDWCDKARNEMTRPTASSTVSKPLPQSSLVKSSLDEVAEEILAEPSRTSYEDSYKGTKLAFEKDGNYLSAKFELNAARADVASASANRVDTGYAQKLLAQAEKAFSSGAYDKALSSAIKARKSIGVSDALETIPLKRGQEEGEPEVEPEGDGSQRFSTACGKCGAEVEPGDVFCAICGERIDQERKCPSCGSKSYPSDKFCRKCGSRFD